MCEQEYAQAGLERMEQLEEALTRAKDGCATDDDWKVIYFECGLTPNVKHIFIKGKQNELNSVSK
jgi:hypothetical protein